MQDSASVILLEGRDSELPACVPPTSPAPQSSALTTAPQEPTFRGLGLNELLVRAVENSGYVTPTPIQAEAIPLLLAGRDLFGQAQTGTGKTAAFALPLLQQIDLRRSQPQVLVLTPTRELAIQVAEAFERYAAETAGLRVAAIYGGQDYMVQFRQLDRGAHVIVGTPGRTLDHLRRGSLQLGALRALVLDEADEMLRMGFAEDVESVLQQLPEQRQIALFSATLPEPIRRIAQRYLRQPAEITIRQKTATADTVRQRFLVVAPQHKNAVLSRVLESEPIDGVIVFVKLRSTTEPLAEYLAHQGHRAAALNGDMPQKQRERIIDHLRSGKVDIVVATDVAARGLDVQRISHVLNFDLPLDSEAYVHRIGRTGRAGRSGEAILFVSPRQQRLLTNLERTTRQPIEPMELPTNRTINKQRVAKFHERITAALSHVEVPACESIVEQYRRNHDVPLEKIAAALAVLAAGEKPLLLKDELPAMGFERGPDRRRPPLAAGPRGARTGRPPGPRRSREGLEAYRLEVGAVHQVTPGQIVGAIANEAQLDGASIGRIEISEEFSTVDLPVGMPPEIFQRLKKVWVVGRQLNISRLTSTPPHRDQRGTRTAERAPRTKKRPGKSK